MFIVPVSRESRQLARLFDDTFERFFAPLTATEPLASRSPALDVVEADGGYIKVSIEGRQVTVRAQSQRNEEKKEGERVVYRERSVSSYARTFTLPVEVDQTDAGAKLENGVLTLSLPKRGARAAAQITVN
jgi:HSP20 family protein